MTELQSKSSEKIAYVQAFHSNAQTMSEQTRTNKRGSNTPRWTIIARITTEISLVQPFIFSPVGYLYRNNV